MLSGRSSRRESNVSSSLLESFISYQDSFADSSREDEADVFAAYVQTHQALKEALSEQTILQEKLCALERLNKPAKFGKPIKVHSIESTRGFVSDDDTQPERIMIELLKAQSMLENARRAAESTYTEQQELCATMNNLVASSEREIEDVLQRNITRHKNELQYEQQVFRDEMGKWNVERSELLSEAESLSIQSQSVVHNTTVARENVEEQRRKIQKLAIELRTSLTRSKELRDQLDSSKEKVALTDNLRIEIDSNNNRLTFLNKQINEQKQVLKAVRISEAARSAIEANNDQIQELHEIEIKCTSELLEAQKEEAEVIDQLNAIEDNVAEADERFKNAQSEMLVLDSDIRELSAEYNRQVQEAIEQGRKNVGLETELRKEKIEAAQRYLISNCDKIHKVETVQNTLTRVKTKLQSRPSTAITSRKQQNPTIKIIPHDPPPPRPTTAFTANRKRRIQVKSTNRPSTPRK